MKFCKDCRHYDKIGGSWCFRKVGTGPLSPVTGQPTGDLLECAAERSPKLAPPEGCGLDAGYFEPRPSPSKPPENPPIGGALRHGWRFGIVRK